MRAVEGIFSSEMGLLSVSLTMFWLAGVRTLSTFA